MYDPNEKLHKKALAFLLVELNDLQDQYNREKLRWQEANAKFLKASDKVAWWQFWRFVQRRIAAASVRAAAIKIQEIKKQTEKCQRVGRGLQAGCVPDKETLDLFQHFSNQALMIQVRLAGLESLAGLETKSEVAEEKSEAAYHLAGALRQEYRTACCSSDPA